MKILFLNPHIDAEHNIAKSFQAQGVGLLFAANSREAISMLKLHGSSIDLAMIHRELRGGDGSGGGVDLIQQIKMDPLQSDLPMILTSEEWNDSDFSKHQRSAQGVNGYLQFPFSFDQLNSMIEKIVGTPAEFTVSKEQTGGYLSAAAGSQSSILPILEDASAVFAQPEQVPSGEQGSVFVLEAPSLELEVSNAMAEVPPAIPPSAQIPSSFEESPLEGASTRNTVPPLASPLESLELFDQPSQEPGQEASRVAELEAPASGALANSSVPGGDEKRAESGVFGEDGAFGEDGVSLLIPRDSAPEELDSEVVKEMPYLFGEKGVKKKPALSLGAPILYSEPVGDALVPGGAAQPPDIETFKKYLLLREQDVAVLSNQLKASQDQVKLLEKTLAEERAQNNELNRVMSEQHQKMDASEQARRLEAEGLYSEINELRFQVKAKNDKAKLLENQLREASEGMENLKERVRTDIRKIRVREKELENRLEIMKKDSEALINARDAKIIELKRKLDLLEFNMDLLQNQFSREKDKAAQLAERLARAAKIVRVAGGLLESEQGQGSSNKALSEEILNQEMLKDKERQVS